MPSMKFLRKLNPLENVKKKQRRNQKCDCGSGVKFKNCCLSKEKDTQVIKIGGRFFLERVVPHSLKRNYDGNFVQVVKFEKILYSPVLPQELQDIKNLANDIMGDDVNSGSVAIINNSSKVD